jgi:hypothetical protein
MSQCKSPCEGCAFTPGAAANKELRNHLKGVICLLGPAPFVCHHGQPWDDPETHKLSPRALFGSGWQICEGWKREVAKLAKTGYYAKFAEATRAIAQCALIDLDTVFKHGEFTGEDLAEKVNDLVQSGYFKLEEEP